MSTVEFVRFSFETLGYPPARVPVLPRMTLGDFFRMSRGKRIVDRRADCGFFVRARYALFHVLTELGVGEDDCVLVPAYHCRTMIEPVVRSGAKPLFYKVNTDLSADIEHVEAMIARCQGRISCLLLPHYFGFPQPMERIVPLLERHGVILIEDCAHVLFDRSEPDGPGSFGDYSIYSPSKFLPCPDGGLLRVRRRETLKPTLLRPHRLLAEARIFVRLLALAVRGQSTAPVRPMHRESSDDSRSGNENLCQRRTIDTQSLAVGRSDFYDPSMENLRGSLWSVRILDTADFADISAARKRNFCWWLEAVSGLPGCRPLFTKLTNDVTPYMFPLILEHPARHFDVLKRLGMPIYRWDELAVSECARSAFFRLHLLQLPCHQGLAEEELQWMLEVLRSCLAQ